MNKKILEIAGVIFALAFLTVFIVIWANSQNIMKSEAESINDLYRSEASFDTSLFDNKIVSAQSIINFEKDMESSNYAYAVKLTWYKYDDNAANDLDDDSTCKHSEITNIESYVNNTNADSFRTYLHHNINGVLTGIIVEDYSY